MRSNYIVFILYCIIIFIVLTFLSKRMQRKQPQKPGTRTGAAGETIYTKEQQAAVKEQFDAHKKTVYANYPETEQFEAIKKKVVIFLIISSFLIIFAKTCFTGINTGASLIALVRPFITAFGINMIFLLCAMGPKWKMAFWLYFIVLKDIIANAYVLSNQLGIRSLDQFLRTYMNGFKEYPVAVSLDLLSWFYTLLVLAAAIWLTLIPKSRELAKQSEILQEQLKNFNPTIRSL